MKWLKIITINFLICIILFFILDFIVYTRFYNNKQDIPWSQKLLYYTQIFDNTKLEDKYIYSSLFRPTINPFSDKKPIAIFGCSYAYGSGLDNNQTFSYLLGKITGRPVYNRALGGMGLQFAYYQLSNKKFYKIVPKPEYIIYVYIQSHIPRMHTGGSFYYNRLISYKIKKQSDGNNYLVRDYPNELLSRSYLAFYLRTRIIKKIKYHPDAKTLELLQTYFMNIRKQAEKNWGKDIKFVILLYEDEKNLITISKVLENLEKKGFIIINANDVSGTNLKTIDYQISESDSHPNEKAWKKLTPLLVKKLGL